MNESMAAPFPFTCMLCHGRGCTTIHQKLPWKYLRCIECGLVHLYPPPEAEKAIDAYDGYLDDHPDEIADWQRMMQPVVTRSADLIETRRGGRKGGILDIGCGYGFFLNEMRLRGWQPQGIEISPAGRKYAQNRFGLRVTHQPAEAIEWPDACFDVITLFYVIEHLLDPPAMLDRVHRWLKPDGLLLLRWPHSTPIVRFLGPLAARLDLYHTPFHIYDFSPRTMQRMLCRCGFARIETVIGGYTRPPHRAARWCSILTGTLGEFIQNRSQGRLLLPGLSKTTLARKRA